MKKTDAKISKLFNTEKSIAGEFIKEFEYPWEVLPNIGNIIKKIADNLDTSEYIYIEPDVYIHKSVKVPQTVSFEGPLIVCEGANLRHGLYIRGNVIIGKNAVAGNSCELKNCIIFDEAQLPHYNYIGDSIIGHKSHFGASALTSNVKSDKDLIRVHFEDGDINTGLKKFGAIIGDGVEVGCGSILNPGTVIGVYSNIYPLSSVRRAVDKNSIYKNQNEIVDKE